MVQTALTQQTQGVPRSLESSARSREIRIRFDSQSALLAAFSRAQDESWIEDFRVDWHERELIVRMAGGFRAWPDRHPVLSVLPGGRA